MKHTTDCAGSSNIEGIEYDADALELTVTFKNGHVYIYEGVNGDEWEGLHAAPSKGSFLAQQIKPNHSARRADS